MSQVWPVTVPTNALLEDSSYSEDGENNISETKPQVGPPLRRRRSSIPSHMVTFSTIMTFTQFDLLNAFYDVTLADGTDTFTRPHPRKGTTVTCSFEARPKSGGAIAGDKFQVQMQIRIYG